MGNICSCLKHLLPGSSGGYSEIPSEVQTTNIGSSANNAMHINQQKSTASASNGYNSSSYNNGSASQSTRIAIPDARSVPKSKNRDDGEDDSEDREIVPTTIVTQSKSAFFAKYELREEIGVGSTCKCYKCIRKTDGHDFACKVIDKRQVELKFSGLLDQFFLEIKVLKMLNHPNIIKLEDTFESPDRIYMVMERMKGGELFDYVVEKGTLSEEEASVLVRKITSAVAHMHSLNIIHRDLKPENLLLTGKGPDAEVKLIDFGLAKIMSDAVASSFLGTKGYLAPEMLQRQSYDKSIDIWALGVIVFVLLCGCLPFDDDSSRISSESAARKKFTLRFPKWASSMSSSAKDLLYNLLEINPKTRYTADQALNHPWVSGKTVLPNSYLQSPSIMGERRKEQRSPLPRGYIQDMHAKVTQHQNASSSSASVHTFTAGPATAFNAAGSGGSRAINSGTINKGAPSTRDRKNSV